MEVGKKFFLTDSLQWVENELSLLLFSKFENRFLIPQESNLCCLQNKTCS